jgi:hypothetical protein
MTSDPDQIRGEIHQTQRELSADVDALTEKVSPPRVLERRVRRTRTTMTDLRNRIMGSTTSGASSTRDTIASTASGARNMVSSGASSAGETVSSAPEVVRRRTEGNPLAAGVIAFGAGWLLSSLIPPTTPEQKLASQVKDAAAGHARPVAQQLGDVAQETKEQLREPARQAAESVRSTATGAASAMAEEAQSAAGDVAGRAQEGSTRLADQTRSSGS